MRIDTEHAYEQQVYNLDDIKDHIIPEWRFRKLLYTMLKYNGGVTGAYAFIDFVAKFNPEFTPKRIIQVKQAAHKMYMCTTDYITKKEQAVVLYQCGVGASNIARALGISRIMVYKYLKMNDNLPLRCVFTYGEYNVILDLLDTWDSIKTIADLPQGKTYTEGPIKL